MTVVPVELGCIGHCVIGHRCRWRRHTQVGLFRVSTIGDYYIGEHREDFSPGKFFETNVFQLLPTPTSGNEGCGCLEVASYLELAGWRYATAGEAQAGHEAAVKHYMELSNG